MIYSSLFFDDAWYGTVIYNYDYLFLQYYDTEFTVWDRFEVKGDMTLKEFLEYFQVGRKLATLSVLFFNRNTKTVWILHNMSSAKTRKLLSMAHA